MAALAAFPTLQPGATSTPPPSALWSPNLTAPYPTNAPWQNFVLNSGTAPEPVAPYLVQLNDTGVTVCYPTRSVQSAYIAQIFVANIMLSVLEGLAARHVVAYDDMSVTVLYGGRLKVPLVRGSPYVTFLLNAATPVLTTVHAVVGLTASSGGTKHRVAFNNGQTWVIYSSSPVSFASDGQSLMAAAPFHGVLRVALLPAGAPAGVEGLLDAHSPVYPTGGSASFAHFGATYVWQSDSWQRGLAPSNLLMLSMPVHRAILVETLKVSQPGVSHPPPPHAAPPPPPPDCQLSSKLALQAAAAAQPSQLAFETIDGPGLGEVGNKWVLQMPAVNIGWHSANGISDPAGKAAVSDAVKQDITALAPITTASDYDFGKQAARAARLALIAEEVGLVAEVAVAGAFLEAALTPWLEGTAAGNAFAYDAAWGGVVTTNGAQNQGADYGNGMYNDHHFHYGYFLYAAAVLAKLNSTWGAAHRVAVRALTADFLSPARTAAGFPRLRHFDAFALHSWASGLTEFADGRNQESSSEAVGAYYAASLVGHAYADLALADLAATLATLEARAAQVYWHIAPASVLYDPAFAKANAIVGVLWANKRDSGLWFAESERYEIRVGIQVLPITPYTQRLFGGDGGAFARRAVGWALPAMAAGGAAVTDAWRGFVWALQGTYDVGAALGNVHALTEFDSGNSLSNLLWWLYSR